MATDEERAARVEALLAAAETVEFGDTEELMRYQARSAFDALGVAAPASPSSVSLRFDGPPIVANSAPAELASTIIDRFQRAVRASARLVRGNPPPSAFDLFLSPQVRPGSTVFQLFARPEPVDVTGQLASTTGTDGAFDNAVEALFGVLEDVDPADPHPLSQIGSGEAELGKHLFTMSKLLVDNNVDLDLTLRRASGRAQTASLHRDRARTLRDLLDVETTDVRPMTRIGVLRAISLAGVVEVDVERGSVTKITVDGDVEAYRDLFARRVLVEWIETRVSHPQRDAEKVTRELRSLRIAGDADHLEFDDDADGTPT